MILTSTLRDSERVHIRPSKRKQVKYALLTSEQRNLVEHHQWVIGCWQARFKSRLPKHIQESDCVQVGQYWLCVAAIRFDESKNSKFCSYAWKMVFMGILKFIWGSDCVSRQDHAKDAKHSVRFKQFGDGHIDRMSYHDKPTEDLAEVRDEVMTLVSQLCQPDRSVIELRFGLIGETCMTLSEVAERLKLTKQRVHQIEERAMRRLKEKATSRAGC